MEELPKSLRYIISEANEAIQNHPNGELILPLRKKIWMEFGTCQENGMPTIGTIRRTMLEIFNIERLMYLWKETLPNDNRPEIIIENIKRYFRGEVSREELKKMFDSTLCSKKDALRWQEQYKDYDFWVACENYLYNDNEAKNQFRYAIGFCACKIKQLALHDSDLSHIEKLDLDYDFYDSYVSYDISKILAPFPWENTSDETIEQRRKYWLWYVNEAIPAVFKAYK
ncbi:MAG TPA: Imm5 family immunity protein [Clostridia bacterium]